MFICGYNCSWCYILNNDWKQCIKYFIGNNFRHCPRKIFDKKLFNYSYMYMWGLGYWIHLFLFCSTLNSVLFLAPKRTQPYWSYSLNLRISNIRSKILLIFTTVGNFSSWSKFHWFEVFYSLLKFLFPSILTTLKIYIYVQN